MKIGRKDHRKNAEFPEEYLIPVFNDSEATIKAKFERMGFTEQEMVALLGQYTIGFSHVSQYKDQRWTLNPYVFDNTYYQEVLLGENSKYLKTNNERMLLNSYKEQCEEYAQDQNKFFTDFANAYFKLSQLGQEHRVIGEIDPSDMIDGGYIESKENKQIAEDSDIEPIEYSDSDVDELEGAHHH